MIKYEVQVYDYLYGAYTKSGTRTVAHDEYNNTNCGYLKRMIILSADNGYGDMLPEHVLGESNMTKLVRSNEPKLWSLSNA